MLQKIKTTKELVPFLTDELLENGVGVIINSEMPQDSMAAINVDKYYHHILPGATPAIADILIVAERLKHKKRYHIYIIEMKNIKSQDYFDVSNLFAKFTTVVEDFMKNRHEDIFLDDTFQVEKFELFFISDAFRLKKKGFTDKQIKSFLMETKISKLGTKFFRYRKFITPIKYQLPNPLLEWF